MNTRLDPTEAYLHHLLAGDTAALLAGFAGPPVVDDPLDGAVRGRAGFERFAEARRAWLAEHAARIVPVRTTRASGRSVHEALLYLRLAEGEVELPVAVVGEQAARDQVRALRVYHSLWPLFGHHRVRPPLLPADPSQRFQDVVAAYQQALDSGDIDAIVNAFEPDGYFREPAGGEWVYRGHARLREFMHHLLSSGGIKLEHCTLTDDGVACALEFNAVQFGPHPLQPQAGVGGYERCPSGRLHAARIYDDVNVEALAAGRPHPPAA
jgi:hypothetical protein